MLIVIYAQKIQTLEKDQLFINGYDDADFWRHHTWNQEQFDLFFKYANSYLSVFEKLNIAILNNSENQHWMKQSGLEIFYGQTAYPDITNSYLMSHVGPDDWYELSQISSLTKYLCWIENKDIT